ncbi:MAG: hydrogenase expression/formation protein HypE [Lutisporaceae bacterium]
MVDYVKLQQGCGGKPTAKLIKEIFYKHFDNDILLQGFDSALLEIPASHLAFTTDSFIVKPHFFAGGDIGKLAICGTANDLSVCGAKPLYLSCAVIIEEGFPLYSLDRIVKSMAKTAEELQLKIVTGDTKVVQKGWADGIYINTSGIGTIIDSYRPKKIKAGDAIILSGGIGEHGAVVAIERFGIKSKVSFQSDCTAVFPLIEQLRAYLGDIKLMKDPTRGGVATALNEIAEYADLGARIYEEAIPIKQEVKAVCDMLGLDAMYLACEGRAVMVVEGSKAKEILDSLRQLECGSKAEIIGKFEDRYNKLVYIENSFGSSRIISSLEGDLLPRIC